MPFSTNLRGPENFLCIQSPTKKNILFWSQSAISFSLFGLGFQGNVTIDILGKADFGQLKIMPGMQVVAWILSTYGRYSDATVLDNALKYMLT